MACLQCTQPLQTEKKRLCLSTLLIEKPEGEREGVYIGLRYVQPLQSCLAGNDLHSAKSGC